MRDFLLDLVVLVAVLGMIFRFACLIFFAFAFAFTLEKEEKKRVGIDADWTFRGSLTSTESTPTSS